MYILNFRYFDFENLDPLCNFQPSTFDCASEFPRPEVKTLKRALVSSEDDKKSPKRRRLKSKWNILKANISSKDKQLKLLNQKLRRKTKQISKLKDILSSLSEKNLINQEQSDMLENISGPHFEIFQRQITKFKNEPQQKEYSAQLRTFALNLNFYSPKAYNYVRESFDNCLPHNRTLSNWYSTTNCMPGFTSEAFDAITNAVNSEKLLNRDIIVNLVFDEIATRQHIDWIPNHKPLGYVDFGSGEESDVKASQVLVFMVVCLNRRWKLPVGYFPIKSINGEQKRNLITMCIQKIIKTGAILTGIAFDGAATNMTACKLLGCDLDLSNETFTFKIDGQEFGIYPDACHNLKLIRNTFGEHSPIMDINNDAIDWKFIKALVHLQESEGLHLGNKIRKAHIFFAKQKMKVRLAAQCLSKSVADAIDFCREVI